MADNTPIEWTDATWNPVTGCDIVSPGCTNCYAMRLAGTRLKHHPSRKGLTKPSKAGPVWNGEIRLNHEWLTQPLQWKRPRMIFVCAHGDLFHESVPDDFLDQVFAVMALAPQHTFQVLTKRSKRMREYIASRSKPDADFHEAEDIRVVMTAWAATPSKRKAIPALRALPEGQYCKQIAWPLPNVWLGVSAEDQKRYDERKDDLRATPASVHFFSFEPLIGPIKGDYFGEWSIVGGESGTGARPMHPVWARSLRDQCAAAGVVFFFKQWGAWLPAVSDGEFMFRDDGGDHAQFTDHPKRPTIAFDGQEFWNVGKKAAGRLLDGVEHNGMPQVRP